MTFACQVCGASGDLEFHFPQCPTLRGATCKHLLRGAPDCVFCHRDQLQQEVNGLLVENANLRGVRDQLLKDDGETIERLRQEIAQLKAERERLQHRCNALAYLHYGHYLVQRTHDSVQADIEACESALTALRAELRALPQKGE